MKNLRMAGLLFLCLTSCKKDAPPPAPGSNANSKPTVPQWIMAGERKCDGADLSLAISKDKWVAAGGYNGKLFVWSYPPAAEPKMLATQDGAVQSLDFSPDGKYLAAGVGSPSMTAKGAVFVWDTTNWSVLVKTPWDGAGLSTVRFAPDGENIVFIHRSALLVQPLRGGKPVTVDMGERVRCVFSRDGQRMASSFKGGSIQIWNWKDRSDQGTLQRPKDCALLHDMAFSPDGARLAVAYSTNGGKLKLSTLDVATGKTQDSSETTSEGQISLVYSADGKTIITGSRSGYGYVLLWDATKLEMTKGSIFESRSARGPVAINAEGTLVTVARDGLMLWMYK